MAFQNSKNALDVVMADISAKKTIALESFSTMEDIRRGGSGSLMLEAGSTFQEFSAKINDVYNMLQNIDMDEAELMAAFKEISRASKNMYEDSTINFVNPDNVGRINPSYIQDFAQEIADTAAKILSGEITSLNGTNVSAPVVEGIKRQIVSGTYKGNTAKNCFGELPKGIPYPYDSSFINTMAVPFVRTFAAKRTEIGSEIVAIEKMSESAFATVSMISQSKEILAATTEARQLLNIYLSAAGTALVDIVSFTTYLIIRKMDIMIANATALNEMCDAIRSNGAIRLSTESTEDLETPVYDVENADKLIGTIRGVYGKIQYNISNFYGETSHPIDDELIENMRSQYSQMMYPAEAFITILQQKKDAITKLQACIRTQEFPSPVQLATDLGLCGNMVSDYSEKLKNISDISMYVSIEDAGPADKAFMALAEIHDLEKIVFKIKSYGDEIAAALAELESIANNPSAMVSNSSAVRDEISDIVNTISTNINGELIPEIFGEIDKKCISLDKYIDSVLLSTTVIVPEVKTGADESDFVEDAMRSILADENIYANEQVATASRKYNTSKRKSITFIATEAEAPATNAGGATPGNPVTTDTAPNTNNNGGKSVEVTEDPNKQTATDAQQNNNAAGNAQKDPKSFKDSIKKVMDEAMRFFEDMVNNFTSTIRSKKAADAAAYITENKEAILGRSFNGVTLKLPFFPELVTTDVVKEIGQVNAAVSALNAQSIKDSDESKLAALLFPFVSFGANDPSDQKIALVKERYAGKKDAPKEEYTGAKLRNKTQDMVTFCEDYYVNKKCEDVSKALTSLKDSVKSMMTNLSSITDANAIPDDAKVKFINRSVKMFSGAITSTYRNQASAYYSAIRSLTPKKSNNPTPEQQPPVEAEANTDQQNNAPAV